MRTFSYKISAAFLRFSPALVPKYARYIFFDNYLYAINGNLFRLGGVPPLPWRPVPQWHVRGGPQTGAPPRRWKWGDGDQAAAKPGFSSGGVPYKKPKTQRIWPTISLKMRGDYPPHSQKWRGRVPPVPPMAEPLRPCYLYWILYILYIVQNFRWSYSHSIYLGVKSREYKRRPQETFYITNISLFLLKKTFNITRLWAVYGKYWRHI